MTHPDMNLRSTLLRLSRRSALVLGLLHGFLVSHCSSQHQSEISDTTVGARIGILPLPVVYYTPETGVALGGALLAFHRADASDTVARPSSSVVDLIYTQKKQIIAEVYPDVYFHGGEYRISGSIHYSKYPLKFYGIGSDTPEQMEEPYTPRTFRLTMDATREIVESVSGGITFFYESRSISDLERGGSLERRTISGSGGGTTVGAGIVAYWDTRDNIFMPRAGRYYLVSLRTALPMMGSDFDFSYLILDLREYFGIGERSTLAAQFLANFAAGDAPFYMLPQLGGATMMRGYNEGRYRDNKLLAVQLEYRFPIYRRFGGAVFTSAGEVAATLPQFSLQAVKPSYGLGLRYLFDPEEKVSIRLDVGFGRQTSGVYITAREAF